MVEGGGVRVECNEERCVYTVANVSKRKWENQSHKNKDNCLDYAQVTIES